MKNPLAALAMAAAVSCSAADRSPVEPSGAGGAVPVIVAFGDSLTAGPGLPPDRAYPGVLQRKLDSAGYRYRVVNAGVSGDTTADGLRRLDQALVADTQVLILAMGANDGLRGVPIATVRANLATMIRTAQQRGIKVLLCGMETPPTHGLRYSVDFHFLFPQLASEYNVPLVPFLLEGVVARAELNLEDGIHPNAEGAAMLAENIWPYLTPLLAAAAITY